MGNFISGYQLISSEQGNLCLIVFVLRRKEDKINQAAEAKVDGPVELKAKLKMPMSPEHSGLFQ